MINIVNLYISQTWRYLVADRCEDVNAAVAAAAISDVV